MRKLILLTVTLMIILPTPQVLAQITIGIPAEQTVEVSIDKEGNVHVVHIVQRSRSTQQVDVINGTLSNLSVTDEDGNEKQYGTIQTQPLGITVFPTQEDVLIKYELEDVLILKDGRWTWDFFYPIDTEFYFPDDVDLIFTNGNPLYIGGRGVQCHGCMMVLEYIIDEPIILKNVEWGDQKFTVVIRTLAEVDSFFFDQSTKRIFFVVTSNNDLVTLIIPLKLLWKPYEVYLNEQKIGKHEFLTNETHALLNFRPDTSGRVDVIGTTVVPEFPLFIPLGLGIALILGIQLKNRLILR